MENKLIELLSEEIRETRNLTIEVRKQADASMMRADAAMRQADAAMKRADASWELVVMTRNDMNRPVWKKWFGLT
jgi:hypothetical protein